jgi:hypothetical protein
VGARVARKRLLARADDYGPDEQLTFIDEPGLESVRGKVRASHGEISGRGSLQVTDRVGLEISLELRLGGRHVKTSSSGALQSKLPCESSM